MAGEDRQFPGTKSLGPDRQLLALTDAGPITGRFELYAEDSLMLLSASAMRTVRSKLSFWLR